MFTLYISLLNQRLGEFPLLLLIYYLLKILASSF